jgi:hypothetical protein
MDEERHGIETEYSGVEADRESFQLDKVAMQQQQTELKGKLDRLDESQTKT